MNDVELSDANDLSVHLLSPLFLDLRLSGYPYFSSGNYFVQIRYLRSSLLRMTGKTDASGASPPLASVSPKSPVRGCSQVDLKGIYIKKGPEKGNGLVL